MSDPFAMLRGMEYLISSAELRDQLATIISSVAFGESRYVVLRHNKEMAAIVSWRELNYLRELFDGKPADRVNISPPLSPKLIAARNRKLIKEGKKARAA